MNRDKLIKASIISVCILCAFTFSNIVLAKTTDNLSDKQILNLKQKELSKLNINDKNNIVKYYELKNGIIDLQESLNLKKEAYKSTEEIIATTISLYGENSKEAGYAYARMLSLCCNLASIRDYKKYLDKLYKVIINNTDCNELKYFYYRYKMGFYGTIDEHYEAIGLINLLKKYTNPKNQNDKLFDMRSVIYSNFAERNFKNLLKDIYNYYYFISKNKNSDISLYIDYYNILMEYYIESSQYNKIPNIYNKAVKLLKGNDEKTRKQKFSLNQRYQKYFIDLGEYDKALILIKENDALINGLNDTNLQNQLYALYKEYYEKQDDFKKVKEYIDKIDTLLKKDNNEIAIINNYNTYINYYKSIDKYKTALKYANKIKETYSDIKDIAPVVYANALKEIADINTNNIKERINTALEAKIIYEKYLPRCSFKLFEINKSLINLYNNSGEFDKALESYKTAKNIILTINEKAQKNYIELTESIIEVYLNKDDLTTAKSLLDEITELSKQVYGKDNIYVYKLYLRKAEMYERFQKHTEADKLFEQITKAINNNKISGTDNDFYYSCYYKTAWKNLQKNNLEEAKKYIKKAEQYAKKEWNKKEIRNLNSELKQALSGK